ncbi:MAG TPA: hypothetical protein VFW19_07375 [Allosphingosinicella sp.]|nr:hypothetical protein [Allosphingosinicella sp.]
MIKHLREDILCIKNNYKLIAKTILKYTLYIICVFVLCGIYTLASSLSLALFAFAFAAIVSRKSKVIWLRGLFFPLSAITLGILPQVLFLVYFNWCGGEAGDRNLILAKNYEYCAIYLYSFVREFANPELLISILLIVLAAAISIYINSKTLFKRLLKLKLYVGMVALFLTATTSLALSCQITDADWSPDLQYREYVQLRLGARSAIEVARSKALVAAIQADPEGFSQTAVSTMEAAGAACSSMMFVDKTDCVRQAATIMSGDDRQVENYSEKLIAKATNYPITVRQIFLRNLAQRVKLKMEYAFQYKEATKQFVNENLKYYVTSVLQSSVSDMPTISAFSDQMVESFVSAKSEILSRRLSLAMLKSVTGNDNDILKNLNKESNVAARIMVSSPASPSNLRRIVLLTARAAARSRWLVLAKKVAKKAVKSAEHGR